MSRLGTVVFSSSSSEVRMRLPSNLRPGMSRGAGDLDALVGGLLRVLVQLGGVEDGLGGDAAAQRAGAAQPRVLLDAHRLEAQLPGADGGDIAARSCSDDRHVVLGHQVLRLQKGGWK